MKKQILKKAISFILCAVMLSALALPISATTTETTVGYDASLVTTSVPEGAIAMSTLRTGTAGAYSYTCPTQGTNYTIGSLEELLIFSEVIKANSWTWSNNRAYVNQSGCFFKCDIYLTADIDCSSIENFEPIGGWNNIYQMWSRGNLFAGMFDGMGHTISGITMDVTNTTAYDTIKLGDGSLPSYEKLTPADYTATQLREGFVGLFRGITSYDNTDVAGVRNLIIGDDCKFVGSNLTGNIGVISGVVEADYRVEFTNIYNKGDVHTAGRCAGGILGYVKKPNNAATSYIKNCTNDGDIIGTGTFGGGTGCDGELGYGGIVGCFGQIKNNRALHMTIDSCVNNGKIVSQFYQANDYAGIDGGVVGGIVGGVFNGKSSNTSRYILVVNNCINNGVLANEAKDGYVGGILGANKLNIYDASKQYITLTNNTNNAKYYAASGSAYVNGVIATGTANTNTDNIDKGENLSVDTRMVIDTALNYSLETYSVDGYEGDYYSLRVVSQHLDNIDSYTEYGYNVSISYADGDTTVTKTLKTPISATSVYSSIVVDNATETPDDGYAYLGAIAVNNISTALGTVTLTVTPYVVYDGIGTVNGAASTFTFNPADYYTAS